MEDGAEVSSCFENVWKNQEQRNENCLIETLNVIKLINALNTASQYSLIATKYAVNRAK